MSTNHIKKISSCVCNHFHVLLFIISKYSLFRIKSVLGRSVFSLKIITNTSSTLWIKSVRRHDLWFLFQEKLPWYRINLNNTIQSYHLFWKYRYNNSVINLIKISVMMRKSGKNLYLLPCIKYVIVHIY